MARTPLGEIEKHFWLTRSVARCLGVSLSEAMAEGQLSAEGYAEMITQCRASHCAGQCEKWLAAQQSVAVAAPEFCANADVMDRLKHPSDSGMRSVAQRRF